MHTGLGPGARGRSCGGGGSATMGWHWPAGARLLYCIAIMGRSGRKEGRLRVCLANPFRHVTLPYPRLEPNTPRCIVSPHSFKVPWSPSPAFSAPPPCASQPCRPPSRCRRPLRPPPAAGRSNPAARPPPPCSRAPRAWLSPGLATPAASGTWPRTPRGPSSPWRPHSPSSS